MRQVDIKTIYKDTKDLITGNDGSDKEPDDFKTELKNSINKGIITKADGSLCIESRKAVDEQGQKIDKMQEDYAKKAVESEDFDTPEEEQEAMKKKKEKERKKREKEAEVIKMANSKQKSSSKSKKESEKVEKQEEKEKIKDE